MLICSRQRMIGDPVMVKGNMEHDCVLRPQAGKSDGFTAFVAGMSLSSQKTGGKNTFTHEQSTVAISPRRLRMLRAHLVRVWW